MPQDDIVRIRVHGRLVGITGLGIVMEEMSSEFAQRPDEEIGAEMIRRLSARNYIPGQAQGGYAAALAREFKKYLGMPVEEAQLIGLRIVVLGPGCSRCSRMEMDVREVLAEMNLPAELLHVTAPQEIAKYGVMGLPALVVNDRVVCVGQTPQRGQIREWLQAVKQ